MVGSALQFVKQGFLTPLPLGKAPIIPFLRASNEGLPYPLCPRGVGPLSFVACVQCALLHRARGTSKKDRGLRLPHPFLDWQKLAMLDCRVTSAMVFFFRACAHVKKQACVGLWRSWERA